MIKPLTYEQRQFLEYVRDNHNSLGWGYTVRTVLNRGEYDTNDLNVMDVVNDFKALLDGYDVVNYGKPTKYLKR